MEEIALVGFPKWMPIHPLQPIVKQIICWKEFTEMRLHFGLRPEGIGYIQSVRHSDTSIGL
jgi:hypothetical protein